MAFLRLIDEGIVKREADGALIHGGFFLGPQARSIAPCVRCRRSNSAEIHMMPISFTNDLHGDEGRSAEPVSARASSTTR